MPQAASNVDVREYRTILFYVHQSAQRIRHAGLRGGES